MKKLLVLVAALALAPAVAFAQMQPPPGGAPWPHPEFGKMRQTMQQMETLHKQFRAKVLGAITPANRALLASLAGQLAISDNPDPRSAVAKLDAALSSGEKQAILNAAQSFMTQARAMRQAAIAKFRAANPNLPSPRPENANGMKERTHRTPDPGELLLMMAMGGGHGPGMMGPRGFGPGMEGPPGGFMRRGPRPTPSP